MIKKRILFIINLFLILFVFLAHTNASENINYIENLSEIKDFVSNLNVDKVIKQNDVVMKLKDSFSSEMFFVPSKKLHTSIQYLGLYNEKISINSMNLLTEWNKIKDSQNNINSSNEMFISSEKLLITKQIDLLYQEMIVINNGRRLYVLVPINLVEKLKNEFQKNQIINVELLLLSYSEIEDNYLLLLNDININKVNNNNEKIVNDLDKNFILANNALKEERFDYSISKYKELIVQYPQQIKYKKDICNALFMKLLKFNSKTHKEVITCYKDILKVEESADIYYYLALLYYNNTGLADAIKYKYIVDYATKVINLLNTKATSKLSYNEKEIYYNSFYLRGIAKKILKAPDFEADLSMFKLKY